MSRVSVNGARAERRSERWSERRSGLLAGALLGAPLRKVSSERPGAPLRILPER